jgi:hypothetical protein
MGMFKYLWNEGDYIIHFKYSSMLNTVYVTLIYGIGLPILFPIAAFTLFNLWVCERISIAYISKLPPALDDTLTINVLSVLKLVPLLQQINCCGCYQINKCLIMIGVIFRNKQTKCFQIIF